MNQRLRECFLGLLHDPLIESGTLGGLIEMARIQRAARRLLCGSAHAIQSQGLVASRVIKSRVKEMVWRNPTYKYLDRWMNSRLPAGRRRSDIVPPIDILRRVAILVLLERQLHRFQDA